MRFREKILFISALILVNNLAFSQKLSIESLIDSVRIDKKNIKMTISLSNTSLDTLVFLVPKKIKSSYPEYPIQVEFFDRNRKRILYGLLDDIGRTSNLSRYYNRINRLIRIGRIKEVQLLPNQGESISIKLYFDYKERIIQEINKEGFIYFDLVYSVQNSSSRFEDLIERYNFYKYYNNVKYRLESNEIILIAK